MIEGVAGTDSDGNPLALPGRLLITVGHAADQLWAAVQAYPYTYVLFGSMLLGAIILRGVPVLGRPLRWAETFYHELSHGLVCVFTGGRVSHLELHPGGGGVCYYRGGWRLPVALAGYLGATLWGAMLYLIGAHLSAATAHIWLLVELAVIGLTWLLWVKKTDLRTTWVLAILALLYGAAWVWGTRLLGQPTLAWVVPYFLQFTGLYVMLNAVESPLVLLRYPGQNDATDLRKITWLPATLWIALWWVFSLTVLGYCVVQSLPGLANPLPVTSL